MEKYFLPHLFIVRDDLNLSTKYHILIYSPSSILYIYSQHTFPTVFPHNNKTTFAFRTLMLPAENPFLSSSKNDWEEKPSSSYDVIMVVEKHLMNISFRKVIYSASYYDRGA